jgi:NAD(P)-dependent dehydrogenase (short-subunit alcohol dehydrogenase family)
MSDGRRVAVVTGAGQGLGEAIARRLAVDGCEVVALDIDHDRGATLAADIDGRFLQCDVADPDAVRAAAAEVGPADILVNNAGIWFTEPTLDASDEHLQAVVAVNILGVLYCSRAFVPSMIERGAGSIVNISSGAAWSSSPGYGVYPASKAAVISLTRQLAMEWGPAGIRVNAVGPGVIKTERNKANFEGAGASRSSRVPLGRTGVPADVADVVSALCSHDMRYVSGQIVYVDGALSAGVPGI